MGFQLAEAFVDVSVRGLSATAQALRSAKDLFGGVAGTVSGGLKTAFNGAGVVIAGMNTQALGLRSVMSGLKNEFNVTGGQANNVRSILIGVNAIMQGLVTSTAGAVVSTAGLIRVSGGLAGGLAIAGAQAGRLGMSLMHALGGTTLSNGQRFMSGIAAAASSAFAAARSAASAFSSGASAAFRAVQSSASSAFSAIRSGASHLNMDLGGIVGKLGGIKGLLLGIAAGAGIGGLGLSMIKGASDMEGNLVAFKTMLGGGDQGMGRAKTLMGGVSKMAADTPFELPELTSATRSLLAFGTAQKDLIPTLTMIGDVSSGIRQPIGQIAEIYGKAKVQGRLFAEDVNQFTGRGIPIIQELAKQFGASESQVKHLVETGKVGFPALERAFKDMTGPGGRFFEMMKEQSRTTQGLFSTMMDNIKAVGRDIGGAMIPALKKIMSFFIDMTATSTDWIAPLKAGIADWSMAVADAVPAVIAWFKSAWPYVEATGSLLVAMGQAFISAIGKVVGVIGSMFRPAIGGIGASVLNAMDDLIFFFENWDTFLMIGVEQTKLFASNVWARFTNMLNNMAQLVVWFGSNWKDIMFSAADVVLTIFINLGENIRSVWQAALDFISGNGFHPDMKPMMEGTEAAIARMKATMPKFTDAAVQETSEALEGLYDKLNKADREYADRKRKGHEVKPGEEEPEMPLADEMKKAGEFAGTHVQKMAFHGLEDFAKRIQQAVSPHEKEEVKDRKDMLKAQQETAANTKKLAEKPDAPGGMVFTK